MPTASPPPPDDLPEQPAPPPPHGPGAERAARRVVLDPGGPVLVEGPVEVELPDGTTARSDRFMVAVCTCGCSGSYPWCDTSHRLLAAREPERPAGGSAQRDPQ